MLYVSRLVWDETKPTLEDCEQYGIVDTDDDTETIVSMNELTNIVHTHNIPIAGVTKVEIGSGNFTSKVEIYQHEKYCSSLQTKLKVMCGVDIRTYKDEITYLVADDSQARASTSIRLSSYGKRMHWQSPIGWINYMYENILVLVLDDNFEMMGPRPELFISGVVWDISQVTNKKLVDSMYKVLLSDAVADKLNIDGYIRDNPERERLWLEFASRL